MIEALASKIVVYRGAHADCDSKLALAAGIRPVLGQLEQETARVRLCEIELDLIVSASAWLVFPTWLIGSKLVHVSTLDVAQDVAWQSASAPDKPQVPGLFLVRECFQHAPEALDEVVRLLAVEVSRYLAKYADIHGRLTTDALNCRMERH